MALTITSAPQTSGCDSEQLRRLLRRRCTFRPIEVGARSHTTLGSEPAAAAAASAPAARLSAAAVTRACQAATTAAAQISGSPLYRRVCCWTTCWSAPPPLPLLMLAAADFTHRRAREANGCCAARQQLCDCLFLHKFRRLARKLAPNSKFAKIARARRFAAAKILRPVNE